MDQGAVRFESFVQSAKPIAAICHGPLTLIEANGVRGRRMTSYPSIQADLRNAGADLVDQEVVTDRGLVTSRKPDDIPAFNQKMIEEFAEGVQSIEQKSGNPNSGKAFVEVEEGTFAGTKRKPLPVEGGEVIPSDTGDQDGGQN